VNTVNNSGQLEQDFSKPSGDQTKGIQFEVPRRERESSWGSFDWMIGELLPIQLLDQP